LTPELRERAIYERKLTSALIKNRGGIPGSGVSWGNLMIRFKPLPCRGTYFQLLDYSSISDAPDTRFARHLTVEHGVAAIPISVFYQDKTDNNVLRFCFAKNDDTLKKAAEILCRI
jgi:aspartate/methionine/tyrosine aminotransferase